MLYNRLKLLCEEEVEREKKIERERKKTRDRKREIERRIEKEGCGRVHRALSFYPNKTQHVT